MWISPLDVGLSTIGAGRWDILPDMASSAPDNYEVLAPADQDQCKQHIESTRICSGFADSSKAIVTPKVTPKSLK